MYYVFLSAGRPNRFLEYEMQAGGGEDTWTGSTGCNIVQHLRTERLLGLPDLEIILTDATRGQIINKETGESRNQKSRQAICNQEGKERQDAFNSTSSMKTFSDTE